MAPSDTAPVGLDDPTDSYARDAQTFARLTEEQAQRVATYGVEEQLADGALVFERGQRSVDCFLVLAGAIEIFDTDADGAPNMFTTYAANQATGEMDLFYDRRILVSGRAAGATGRCGSSAPTSAAWSRPRPTSARSSCARSSCAASG